jgi:MFS family permease
MILNVAVFLPTYVKGRNTADDWDQTDFTLDAEDVSQIIAIF